MKLVCLMGLLLFTGMVSAQHKDEVAIRKMLNGQVGAWNRGDLVAFMQPYWKSDSLMFIGKNGVQRGWQKTLDNYRKSYPDTAAMGQLAFEIISIKRLSPEYYHVVGKWILKRTMGDLSGHYDLVIRKIKGQWKIISDHSS